MRHAAKPLMALATALVMTGCGTTGAPATLAAAPAAPAPAVAAVAAPSVSVAASAPEVTVTAQAEPAPGQAGAWVVGTTDLTDEELKADAAKQDPTYHVAAAISVPHVAGFVRRGDSRDYLLQASKNEYGEAQDVTYRLYCPDFATYTWLGEHVNQKVEIKGLFNPNHTVTVTFADKALDLSFLTNWLSKGKFKGQVFSTNGLPVVNAEVKVLSPQGFIFFTNTDDNGNYTLANLDAGWYQLWFTKRGYTVITTVADVYKRKATEVDCRL
ncbi:MAG: Carboxypeptidase regulatory-like domain [Cyanobacteria bacterium RYN_339]|nr:Carboxypeptidase regulatory-like domain [Cyanobacteria bacterium RYN_339]